MTDSGKEKKWLQDYIHDYTALETIMVFLGLSSDQSEKITLVVNTTGLLYSLTTVHKPVFR